MDSVQLSLDIQNSLVDTLRETQQSMNRFNTLLDKSGKLTKTVDDHWDDISSATKKSAANVGIFSTALEKVKRVANMAMSPIANIFSAAKILDSAKAVLDHNTKMTQLSFRMGEAGKTTQQLSDAMYSLSMRTGITTENAAGLISQLRQARVATGDIEELAVVTTQFSEITGIGADNAGRLAGELVRVGRLGGAQVESVLKTMANVQRNVGMTETEMTQLNESIIQSTRHLANLGKTEADIVRFSKGITNLAGAFTKAGLEAQEATGFIEKMLDPGAIEDNALLFAKLGVSIADVISGDVDIDRLPTAFKELGETLDGMSRPAAAALAQSMGMTYKQAMSLSEIMENTSKSEEELAKMRDEALTPQEKMQKEWVKVQTEVQELMTKLLPYFSKFVEGITGLFGGGGKAKLVVGALLLGKVLMAVMNRVGKKMFTMNTAAAKHQEQVTAEALINAREKADAVAAGRTPTTKGGSGGGAISGRLNTGIQNRLNAAREEEGITFNRLKNQREELKVTRDKYMEQANYIKSLGKEATPEQQWERNKLIRKAVQLKREMTRAELELVHQTDRFDKLTKGYVRDLAPEQRYIMLENLKDQKESFDIKIKEDRLDRSRLRQEAMMLRTQEEIFTKERDQFDVRKKGVANTRENVREYNRLNDEVRKVGEHIKENLEMRRQTTRQIEDATKEQTRLGNEIKKISGAGDARRGGIFTSGLHRVQKVFRAAGSNIRSAMRSGADRVITSARNFARTIARIARRLRPSNWLSGIKASFKGQDAQGKKTFGMLGKLASVGMMLVGMLLAAKPVQEAIQKVMKAIKPIFEKLGSILGPVLEKIAKALIPIFQKLVDLLLPPLVKGLGVLLIILGKVVEVIGNLITAITGMGIDLGVAIGGMLGKWRGQRGELSAEGRLSGEMLEKISTSFFGEAEGRSAEDIRKDIGDMNKEQTQSLMKAVLRSENSFFTLGKTFEQAGKDIFSAGVDLWNMNVSAMGGTAPPAATPTAGRGTQMLNATAGGFQLGGFAGGMTTDEQLVEGQGEMAGELEQIAAATKSSADWLEEILDLEKKKTKDYLSQLEEKLKEAEEREKQAKKDLYDFRSGNLDKIITSETATSEEKAAAETTIIRESSKAFASQSVLDSASGVRTTQGVETITVDDYEEQNR
tara:strand:- start:2626 stop:6087 length:3462 start_codon:yes stop_codon:yes gene_type:complete